jgi:hypothetical protein
MRAPFGERLDALPMRSAMLLAGIHPKIAVVG